MEIFPFKLFASVEPTILYSNSSSNSISKILTLHPMLILSRSTSSSTTTSAFFKIFSMSSIRASISLCSSFAASYSAFSERSPCSLASLIFAATSFLLTTFNSCNSSSSFLSPSFTLLCNYFLIPFPAPPDFVCAGVSHACARVVSLLSLSKMPLQICLLRAFFSYFVCS